MSHTSSLTTTWVSQDYQNKPILHIMKRRASDSDIRKAHRRYTRGNAGTLSTSIPTWKSPSPTSTLSQQAIASPGQQTVQYTPKHTFRYISNRTRAFIEQWLETCRTYYEPQTMAPPAPPSATASERRNSRRHRITQGQTSTRTKTITPQTYRLRNMYQAGIYVEQLDELPLDIDKNVQRILGIASWGDRVTASPQLQTESTFDKLAKTFFDASKKNARNCALEAAWQYALNGVVTALEDLSKEQVKTDAADKVWRSELKDTQKTQTSEPMQNASPSIGSSHAIATDTDNFDYMSPSSYASSISTQVRDPFDIKTLKPNITVGLSDRMFTPQHQRLLIKHQAQMSILSDPHASEIGIRFPFLIVESKGFSSAGNLVSAQNQAAVGGACMLKILMDLTKQALLPITPIELPSAPTLCFSIVTEGPQHELWVNFELEGVFHMQNVKSWRTTIEHDAKELVATLSRIMKWGEGPFKDCIVEKLNRVPRV